MEFKNWLSEMPMQNFQRIGDWEPEKNPTQAYLNRKAPKMGYYSDDFGILTNAAAVEKIKRKWSKCEEPFNVFMLRSKEAFHPHRPIREVGMVDVNFLSQQLKLPQEVIQQIDNPDAINIVYTGNVGGQRMPMNWWTLAHRVGHALDRGGYQSRHIPAYEYYTRSLMKSLYDILDQVFGYERKSSWETGAQMNQKMLLALATEIGSMKSARERKIRPSGPDGMSEFFHELTAQYIIEGKVHFRPIPRMLIMSYTWGHPQGHYTRGVSKDDMEMWNDYLEDHLAPQVTANIGVALHQAIGKIFVM